MKQLNVAIDGPSGAGKSTIARTVAAEMRYIYVDTGALYRAIGLAVSRARLDTTEKIIALLPSLQPELTYLEGIQRVILNGTDVSDLIRTPQISAYASQVSAIAEVRAFLFELQRSMAEKGGVIMDGRDIGTVILPDAEVKIFLTASAEKRAERRYLEVKERDGQITYEQVLADMRRRDELDASREAAPLRQAEDAVLVDTSDMDLEQSIAYVRKIIEQKRGEQ